jgi:hypothetical protein
MKRAQVGAGSLPRRSFRYVTRRLTDPPPASASVLRLVGLKGEPTSLGVCFIHPRAFN